jgi:hypothetical protein
LCTLCFQKGETAALVANATLIKQEGLLADLNFQSVSGLYKHFTRMSPAEFESLSHLTGKIISKMIERSGKPFLFKNGWH